MVVLTDSTTWSPPRLQAFRDSLQGEGFRVLISGYPAETAAEMVERLPWLLQPGVDVFLYDERLAGPAARDSLENALSRLGHPATVQRIR